jgi:predicted RNA-binding protein YlqC (UPF0109 family)
MPGECRVSPEGRVKRDDRRVTVEDLRRVLDAIEVVVGADAPVDGVALGRRGDVVRVDITTGRPGRIIGRRGATADALRARIAEHLRVTDVQLNIVETRSGPGEPPREPPGAAGLREPRRPRPGGPPTSDALRLPMQPEELPAPERPGTPLPPAEQRPTRRGAA